MCHYARLTPVLKFYFIMDLAHAGNMAVKWSESISSSDICRSVGGNFDEQSGRLEWMEKYCQREGRWPGMCDNYFAKSHCKM